MNEEKTQILPIGNTRRKGPPDFEDKIVDKIKILGAYFCTDKKMETEANLKRPAEMLSEMNKKHRFNVSLMGKILNLNAYIFSKLWHTAWLLNTEDKHFKIFEKEVVKYLQLRKGEEIYKLVSKKKEYGGLNLINFHDRIATLQAEQLLKALDQIPETDNIIYNMSTNQRQIFGTITPGPTSVIIKEEFKTHIRDLEKNR